MKTVVFIGGEAAVEFFEFQEVSAIQWASELGAHYFALEHRFYGHSNPFPSLSTENLRYLTSSQALADAAQFVLTMKSTYSGPWIALGCSYSGALSAWFRSKYPSLAIASVAPSGPTFAETNFTQFNYNFGNVAPTCVSAATQASQLIFKLTKSSQGLSELSKLFNACKPIRSEDITFFLWTIYDWMATNAQWENPPQWQLTQACQNLTKPSRPNGSLTPTQAVANWEKGSSFASQSQQCTEFTVEAFAKPLRDTSLGNDDRTWYFQQCTEFGFFDGANLDGSSIFQGNVLPNVEFTNANYGGYNVTGTNIYFTNGAFDPWHTLSVTSVESNSGQFSDVYAAGHCAPMTAPTSQDPPSLTQTRTNVKGFLTQVLADYYSDRKDIK